jgi:hypothetical protein
MYYFVHFAAVSSYKGKAKTIGYRVNHPQARSIFAARAADYVETNTSKNDVPFLLATFIAGMEAKT